MTWLVPFIEAGNHTKSIKQVRHPPLDIPHGPAEDSANADNSENGQSSPTSPDRPPSSPSSSNFLINSTTIIYLLSSVKPILE